MTLDSHSDARGGRPKGKHHHEGEGEARRVSRFLATETLPPFLRAVRRVVNWPFLMLIKLYKLLLSPIMGRSCRFTPTCSTYTYEAIEKYGIIKGGLLGAWRILRCNPWGGSGYDPVP